MDIKDDLLTVIGIAKGWQLDVLGCTLVQLHVSVPLLE